MTNQERDEAERLRIIERLRHNDPNGTYTDADSQAEGMEPLTLETARGLCRNTLADAAEQEPRTIAQGEPKTVCVHFADCTSNWHTRKSWNT